MNLRAIGDILGLQAQIPGIDPELFIVQVDFRLVGQQIHIGFPQALDGAHVLPIAVEGIGHHLFPMRQHGGDDILAKVVG